MEPIEGHVHIQMSSLVEMFNSVGQRLKKGRTESVYQNALTVELQLHGYHYTEEETIPILYKGRSVGQERIDIIVHTNFECIIELKATTTGIKPDNIWQLLNYMQYKDVKYGVVVNFNQSPTKNLSYVFVILENGVPYTFDITTNIVTKITDYEYVI